MNVIINGEPHTLKDACNLHDVLDKIQVINRFGIAIAVNNLVVSKMEWEKYVVQNNDNILIINAIFGG